MQKGGEKMKSTIGKRGINMVDEKQRLDELLEQLYPDYITEVYYHVIAKRYQIEFVTGLRSPWIKSRGALISHLNLSKKLYEAEE